MDDAYTVYIYIYTPRKVEAKNVPTRNGVVYKVLGPVITIPKYMEKLGSSMNDGGTSLN